MKTNKELPGSSWNSMFTLRRGRVCLHTCATDAQSMSAAFPIIRLLGIINKVNPEFDRCPFNKPPPPPPLKIYFKDQ